MNEVIEHIDLDRIVPSRGNRAIGGFDQGKLEQLSESIKAVGVQQPAIVRAIEGGYELVAGERRWRASKLAGMEYLPCVVRDLTDDQLLKIQVIENLQREDVHPLDEADGYERLRTEGGYDPELIAHEVGKSVSYVYQRLRLQKLCEEARSLLVEGEISTAVAVLLARIGEEQQRMVIKAQINDWNIKRGVVAHDINDWINQNILLEMDKAVWKMNDSSLVKKAGACSECAKRTGSGPSLFEDITTDNCTDGNCYREKQKAIMAINLKSLEGKEHLIVRDSYGVPNNPGSLSPHEWTEVKKDDDGAIPAIVINGPSPGRLTYAIKKVQSMPSWRTDEESPEDIAREEIRVNRLKAKEATNLKLFGLIMEKGLEDGNLIILLHHLAKREVSRSHIEPLVKWYGWEHDADADTEAFNKIAFNAIDRMNTYQSVAFLMATACDGALKMRTWDDDIDSELKTFIDLYEIDFKTIQAEEYASLGVSVEDPDDEDDEEETEEDEEE